MYFPVIVVSIITISFYALAMLSQMPLIPQSSKIRRVYICLNPELQTRFSALRIWLSLGFVDKCLQHPRGILDLSVGESLAIVGESGAGKSVFTKTFLGMLDANGWVDSGSIMFEGMDLAKFKTEAEWLKIRGKKIAMVFQDPMTALNP